MGKGGIKCHICLQNAIVSNTSCDTRIQFGEALAQDSPVCPFCGARGCFETLYGLWAVVRRVHSNPASTLYHSKPEDIIKPEHMAEIILEARRGDIGAT